MSVTVAGAGLALRSNDDVTLLFQVYGTRITQKNSKTDPIVYIPIPNPQSTTMKLKTVRVDCFGSGNAGKVGMVNEVEVYYGSQSIYDSSSDLGKSSPFSENVGSAAKQADVSSYGINVTLHLSLPDTSSSITLSSVDLTFSDS